MYMNVFDHNTFLDAFVDDLEKARYTVLLQSAYITLPRIEQIVAVLRKAAERGIRICFFIQHQDSWEYKNLTSHERRKLAEIEAAIRTLESAGVHVTARKQEHVKIAVIDSFVLWDGSLNIASHNPKYTIERMTRKLSLYWSMEAIVRHNLNHCPRCAAWWEGRENREILVERASIGKLIEDLRIEKGLTQEKLAEACGLERASINRFENGKVCPSIDALTKVATALDSKLAILPYKHMPFIEQMLLLSPDK